MTEIEKLREVEKAGAAVVESAIRDGRPSNDLLRALDAAIRAPVKEPAMGGPGGPGCPHAPDDPRGHACCVPSLPVHTCDPAGPRDLGCIRCHHDYYAPAP